MNTSRNSKEYKQWREKVLKRDGFKCTLCGATENLHVHHVFSYEKFEKTRIDIRNGQTVCEDCHKIIHG